MLKLMKSRGFNLITVSLLSIALFFLLTPSTSALSGSDFDAGNIISDSVFFDKNAMSATEIQNFLDSKVPTCDTNGLLPIYGTTRAAYGASVGNPAPYTCLKDYTESVSAITNGGSDLCTSSVSGGTKTAARIIYDVAQACGINPQVLLVLLQKEQSLVTDDWPWERQYTKATGYGCPDTTLPVSVDANQNGCYDDYEGFFLQMYNAAKGFRRYEANPNSYNYKAGRNNSILYHPNTSCGSSTVYIENQATANLYIYTPYQPNAAALNNLYGTGDSCSAYGNRNFWRMFTDWFGSTQGEPNFATDYYRYKNTSLYLGGDYTGELWFENEGTTTWYDNTGANNAGAGTPKVFLYTDNELGRSSTFGATWNANRNVAAYDFAAVYESDGVTLAADQHRVLPDQIAKYDVRFTVPANTAYGTYREYFKPSIYQSPNSFNSPGSFLDITVQRRTFISEDYYRYRHTSVVQNESTTGELWFRNVGNQRWYDNTEATSRGLVPTLLYTGRNVGRSSTFGATWNANRNVAAYDFAAVYESDGVTLAADQHITEVGQIAKYDVTFSAPDAATPGKYREYFQPSLYQRPSSFNDPASFLDITVIEKSYLSSDYYRYKHESADPGDTVSAELWYENKGNQTWYDETGAVTAPAGTKKVMLYTTNPLGSSSIFGDNWGPSKNVPGRDFTTVYENDGVTLAADQHRVLPGQIARYVVSFYVPPDTPAGKYRTFMRPSLFQNNKAFNDPVSFIDIDVSAI